ncbi:MAG: prepilin-type N-terminal cleavage/methylation domain-containing protein [Alphaproteobacteria bacterium]|nr:prepilin-type N-terminal cleavage/methylation domain-containing protein [Alphaproteobacteria bacterium]
MKTRSHRNSEAFTLVELSIVLVIIGLIIGGVLSGRQILANAQTTNAINAFQSYQAQFQTYTQNYGAMPGDDSNAQARFTGAGTTNTTSPNGTLEGAFDSTTDTESRLAWSHLRAAGLVKGAGSSVVQPSNPFGGIFGFQNGAFTGTGALSTNVICLNRVPGDAATTIDTKLDDGVPNSGSVSAIQETTPASTAPAASYSAASTYTMCGRI